MREAVAEAGVVGVPHAPLASRVMNSRPPLLIDGDAIGTGSLDFA